MRMCAAVGAAVLILTPPLGASPQQNSREAADRMGVKVQAMVGRFVSPDLSSSPLRTSFTEQELNAYLDVHGQDFLAPGIENATVALLDGGTVDIRTTVDLDAVRKAETRGWLDPLAYVSGMVVVRTVGTFRTAKGQGTFTLTTATVDGVAVPKALLVELVAFHTRSPELPNGTSIDGPFALPIGIREVELRRGGATVVQ